MPEENRAENQLGRETEGKTKNFILKAHQLKIPKTFLSYLSPSNFPAPGPAQGGRADVLFYFFPIPRLYLTRPGSGS